MKNRLIQIIILIVFSACTTKEETKNNIAQFVFIDDFSYYLFNKTDYIIDCIILDDGKEIHNLNPQDSLKLSRQLNNQIAYIKCSALNLYPPENYQEELKTKIKDNIANYVYVYRAHHYPSPSSSNKSDGLGIKIYRATPYGPWIIKNRTCCTLDKVIVKLYHTTYGWLNFNVTYIPAFSEKAIDYNNEYQEDNFTNAQIISIESKALHL